MKRETLILPLNLPRLTDKSAAQLIAVLRELVTAIEYYYAAQIDRDHRREPHLRPSRQPSPSTPSEPPF